MPDAIASLCTLAEYAAGRRHIFRSDTSVEWFCRQHRRELTQSGALLVIGGRRMVNPLVADQIVLQIGAAAAQRAPEPA